MGPMHRGLDALGKLQHGRLCMIYVPHMSSNMVEHFREIRADRKRHKTEAEAQENSSATP